jgi:hypothetical protein
LHDATTIFQPPEGFDDEGREVLEYVADEIRDSYDDDELRAPP